jgi:hypothetical protein
LVVSGVVGLGCGEEDLGEGKERVSDKGLLMMDQLVWIRGYGIKVGIWFKLCKVVI